MMRGRVVAGARARALGLLVAGLLQAAAPLPATAQTAATGEPPAAADEGEADAGGERDLLTLVSPVALYPDPLLALVLQGSLQPLQIVQAERFLEKRENDRNLAPDPAWDPSVLGLLNYPALIEAMNEYLDWTEALGESVTEDLPGVQDAVQSIRGSAYTLGILESDQWQKVIVKDDLVLIMPADPGTVSVPQYDPQALLAALAPAAPEEAVAEPAAAEPAAPVAAASEAEAPPPAAAAPPAPEPAPASVVAAPAYAPPPAISYAPPQTSFWSSAATFAGGAVVGGLLGYALNDDDDDDDDWHDWDEFRDHIDDDDWDDLIDRLEDEDRPLRRPDVDIEDSTIVVGGDRFRQDKVQARLRDVREGRAAPAKLTMKDGRLQRVGRGDGDRKELKLPKGAAPAALRWDSARPEAERARAAKKDIRLPGAKARPQLAAVTRDAKPARPQQLRQGRRDAQGVSAGLDRARHAAKDRDRGAASRQAAGLRHGGGQKLAPLGKERPKLQRAGGQKPLGGLQRGDRAKRDSDRGKKSLAGLKNKRQRG